MWLHEVTYFTSTYQHHISIHKSNHNLVSVSYKTRSHFSVRLLRVQHVVHNMFASLHPSRLHNLIRPRNQLLEVLRMFIFHIPWKKIAFIEELLHVLPSLSAFVDVVFKRTPPLKHCLARPGIQIVPTSCPWLPSTALEDALWSCPRSSPVYGNSLVAWSTN